MKSEWNLIIKKYNFTQFLFFYNFLLIKNDFLFLNKYKNLCEKIYKFFQIQKNTTSLFFNKPSFNAITDKELNKFNGLTINNVLLVKHKNINFSKSTFVVKTSSNCLLSKMINLFFIFNYNLHNLQFKTNHVFKFLHIESNKKISRTVNVNKIFHRWKNTYYFLFNIFYYNFSIFIFGSYLFKNEILSLNWIYNDLNWNTWRYHFTFFMFKANAFNKKIEFFYEKLCNMNLDFLIITDPHYHFKNIYYFNKFKFFTVALADFNLDPTLFSYAIPVASSNILFQFFFFKFLLTISREVNFSKHNLYKKIWWNRQKHSIKNLT